MRRRARIVKCRISGASVIVEHEPTGATKALESNDSGNFFQSGLRVGGPYTITVRAPGEVSFRHGDRIGLTPRAENIHRFDGNGLRLA